MSLRDCVFVVLGFASTAIHLGSSAGDDVIHLNPSNFNKEVIASQDLWIVEFFAPWCGHCQRLAPEWAKAASALKGVVKIADVDADQHKELAGQYGVRGFPTIKIFGANKNSPIDYKGQRTASGIVEEALKLVSEQVRKRLSGDSSDQKSSGGGGSGGGSSGGSSGGSGGSVIELTDSNFDKLVLQSDDLWLVEFFAPWCGHCKSLEPHWKQAASELGGKMKLGAVDATVHNMISSRYGVQGFPSIKFFPADRSDKNNPSDYDGGRTSDDIVKWAMDKVTDNIAAPDVTQMITHDSLTNACENHQLCIVSILPNILDCQAKCRKAYIKTLTQLGDKYKKKIWGWVWAEAGAQPEVETALGIGGFGYPAMAAVNSKKKKVPTATLR